MGIEPFITIMRNRPPGEDLPQLGPVADERDDDLDGDKRDDDEFHAVGACLRDHSRFKYQKVGKVGELMEWMNEGITAHLGEELAEDGLCL